MSWCTECGADIEPETFPYSDGVTCPSCKVELTTDWDESYDSMYWWVTGVKSDKGEDNEARIY